MTSWEKTKFAIGAILLGHFWYTNFWVPNPPSGTGPFWGATTGLYRHPLPPARPVQSPPTPGQRQGLAVGRGQWGVEAVRAHLRVQVADKTGTEEDQLNECLCPVDMDWGDNMITDDEIHRVFVDESPSNIFVTCVFDCCHSGTMAGPGRFKGWIRVPLKLWVTPPPPLPTPQMVQIWPSACLVAGAGEGEQGLRVAGRGGR